MKYLDYALVVLILIASGGAIFVYILNERASEGRTACTMDALMCEDGSMLGRTGPDCTFPDCPSMAIPPDVSAQIDAKKDRIVLTSPIPLSKISSPVTLTGIARGYWFFEGSFPVTIVDESGRTIGEGMATAQGEWMTEEFVPFTATIPFTFDTQSDVRAGTILLQKDNPSGLPENDDALKIPVTF
jgi:hypothetical protein